MTASIRAIQFLGDAATHFHVYAFDKGKTTGHHLLDSSPLALAEHITYPIDLAKANTSVVNV